MNKRISMSFFGKLKVSEGGTNRIYTDENDIPTMGVGTALVVRKRVGAYALHEELDARIRTLTDGGELTGSNRKRLKDVVDALNADDVNEAKSLVPVYDKNLDNNPETTAAQNTFSITATDEGMRNAANADMESARQSAWNDVERAATRAGMSTEEIEVFKRKFEHSDEIMAMASFKYNAGDGERMPDTADAIVTGDRARAVFEMEFRSNGGKNKGIANRRADEADLMQGGDESAAFNASYQQLLRDNRDEVLGYVEQFPDAFREAEGFGDLKTLAREREAELNGEPSGNKKQPEPKPAARPESQADDEAIRKLGASLIAPGDPVDETLLRPDLTHGELSDLMQSRPYLSTADSRHGAAQDKVRTWFEDRYGNEPAKVDATGRMIVAEKPVNPPPSFSTIPVEQPTGRPLGEALGRIARTVTAQARKTSAPDAVRELQNTFNDQDDPLARPVPMLKTDGIAGPKTRRALRFATATIGAHRVLSELSERRFF